MQKNIILQPASRLVRRLGFAHLEGDLILNIPNTHTHTPGTPYHTGTQAFNHVSIESYTLHKQKARSALVEISSKQARLC